VEGERSKISVVEGACSEISVVEGACGKISVVGSACGGISAARSVWRDQCGEISVVQVSAARLMWRCGGRAAKINVLILCHMMDTFECLLG